jgi:hypothetical protein
MSLCLVVSVKVKYRMAQWFHVVCAECARRYGVDLVRATFRADIANWGSAEIQVRRKPRSGESAWTSINLDDASPDWAYWPTYFCDHNHVFSSLYEGRDLWARIEEAIVDAYREGSEVAFMSPDGRQPMRERVALRQARIATTPR